MTDFCDDCHSMNHEAEQAINFVKFGVNSITVSKKLENSETVSYLNLCTLENLTYSIRLTVKGYQVVSFEYDCVDDVVDKKEDLCAESIDALLNLISPLFVQKFSERLTDKLKCLE